ncbi:hypothetical protein K9M42_03105 [Patescibacteria group bacterium]|nr:hypothetical protein [Patescibacteria group bacterium]
MNWYKKSQFVQDDLQNINTPNIIVQPYEPLIQEVVEEIRVKNANFFQGVNQINIDTGFGQFGSVESINPADININLNKIKSEVINQLNGNFDENNPEHRQVLKNKIEEVIVHEKRHVQDASEAQEKSDKPLQGQDLFPGGEAVAEQAVEQYFN